MQNVLVAPLTSTYCVCDAFFTHDAASFRSWLQLKGAGGIHDLQRSLQCEF